LDEGISVNVGDAVEIDVSKEGVRIDVGSDSASSAQEQPKR
jgi:hypothetical protein